MAIVGPCDVPSKGNVNTALTSALSSFMEGTLAARVRTNGWLLVSHSSLLPVPVIQQYNVLRSYFVRNQSSGELRKLLGYKKSSRFLLFAFCPFIRDHRL
jgi:hypothetical protein